ncbi:hypothetical protein [Streptomyces sp. MBT27]|uniref:hypothetical protein n=1 Tax=Streptomyces sp. MBT27 TaxID=1488356 RepID=UPI00142302C0|nr:hypothetical protein [Streptomyces sp. MBT27]
MNLPGNSIDVGVTRIPAPAAGVGPGAEPVLTAASLAALLTAEERLTPLAEQISRDDLMAGARLLLAAAGHSVEARLLALLREATTRPLPAGGSPIVSAEFITTGNGDDATWEPFDVYLKRADGTEITFEALQDAAPEGAYDEFDDEFSDLLALYAEMDPPAHNSNLEIDLVTGEFEVTGPNFAS